MNYKKILLISASLGIGLIGLGYLVSPELMYSLYNIEISGTNQFNMVRGAYGGLFSGFAVLFLVGAFQQKFECTALVSLFVFMSGFAIGRVSGILFNGLPSALILCLLAFEIFYSACSAYCLFKSR